jgi:hypothetical protein
MRDVRGHGVVVVATAAASPECELPLMIPLLEIRYLALQDGGMVDGKLISLEVVQ